MGDQRVAAGGSTPRTYQTQLLFETANNKHRDNLERLTLSTAIE